MDLGQSELTKVEEIDIIMNYMMPKGIRGRWRNTKSWF